MYMNIPTCMYEHPCIHLYERLCMHTYILREEREEQKEGEGGRKEVQLSASAPEQLNRGGGGSQAASEPGSERGTAVVEKLILEIHCCWGVAARQGTGGLAAH